MNTDHYLRRMGFPVLPFMELYVGDHADKPQKDAYVTRLENVYKLAAKLKELEEAQAPRWLQISAKAQLFAALEP